jgi:cytochrome P450
MFGIGAAVTAADLEGDVHPVLRRLRADEPVSWLPALGGWLVTSRDLALRVLRDSGSFTVDDPRFSTARVVGPSMLSLDGAEHKRHREPFAEAFRLAEVEAGLREFVGARAESLVSGLAAAGGAELRRSVAGPLAVAVVAETLGLGDTDPQAILSWYDDIVGAVSAMAGQPAEGHPAGAATREATAGTTAGAQAFTMLSERLRETIDSGRGDSLLAAAARTGGLSGGEVVSNAAVLAFGGIETTEGMICNAVWYLLSDPGQLRAVIADPSLVANAVEESLRMEPAAAVVDRYAAADVRIGPAQIRRGDLVTVSLAGAGRDPAFFPDPDRFDVRRANARQHLAFAHGPHFCLGAHLARLEAQAAVRAVLRLPRPRLDPARRHPPRGIVFRKPAALHVLWDAP